MNRRTFLGAAAVGLLGGCVGKARLSPYSSGSGSPRIQMPRGACDSHIHILDPRFPAREGWRGEGVGEATVDAYRSFQRRIGTQRTVIVTPSTYGIDNRATLDALQQFGPSARGVAVIDCDNPPPDLAAMADAGITGLRVNFVSPQVWGATDARRLRETARLAADRGWHVQVYARGADLLALEQDLAWLPVPLVIDHLGHIAPGQDRARSGQATVLRLLDRGQTWLKLSGAYISSEVGAPDYADLLPLARTYVAAAPERLVWGSDWPHRGQSASMPDDARLADLLLDWAPDARTRHAILVENPAQLYGFDRNT